MEKETKWLLQFLSHVHFSAFAYIVTITLLQDYYAFCVFTFVSLTHRSLTYTLDKVI